MYKIGVYNLGYRVVSTSSVEASSLLGPLIKLFVPTAVPSLGNTSIYFRNALLKQNSVSGCRSVLFSDRLIQKL